MTSSVQNWGEFYSFLPGLRTALVAQIASLGFWARSCGWTTEGWHGPGLPQGRTLRHRVCSHSSAAPSGPQMLDFLGVHLSYTIKKPEGDVQSWWCYLKITKEECYRGCFIQTFIVLFFSYMVRLICCDHLYLESSNFQKNFCKSSVTYDAPSKVILHKLLGCTAYHGSFRCISILSPKEIVRKNY